MAATIAAVERYQLMMSQETKDHQLVQGENLKAIALFTVLTELAEQPLSWLLLLVSHKQSLVSTTFAECFLLE